MTAPQGMPIRYFASHEQYADWREGRLSLPVDISEAVATALAVLGVRPDTLGEPVRLLLHRLGRESMVPTLKAFQQAITSRRTFFRYWTLAEHPSQFLRRVRCIRATQLLRLGMTLEEALRNAGFRSPRELRRELGRFETVHPSNTVDHSVDDVLPGVSPRFR